MKLLELAARVAQPVGQAKDCTSMSQIAPVCCPARNYLSWQLLNEQRSVLFICENLSMSFSTKGLENAGQAVAQDGSSEYELYISAGGVTAVLSGVGFQLAAAVAGIKKWKRIHGVSGGSIIGSVAACGHTPTTLLHLALNLRFGEYVHLQEGCVFAPIRNPFSWTRCAGHEEWRECHWYGLLGTRAVGDCVLEYADELGKRDVWPAGFTTMATTRYGDPVVFTENRVFLVRDGKEVTLSDKPAPLGLAVRASCTIGGVMVPLSYQGNVLFDGGLSRDGFCPVGIPIRHLGANPKKMIAVRVNEVHPKTFIGRVHRAVRWAWWVQPDFHWGPETAGVVEIHPPIQHVATLSFHCSRDEKWLAILLAFQESLQVLALEGLLGGEGLEKAQAIMKELGYWRDMMPAGAGRIQRLAAKAEAVFTEFGLY